jgi:hypothetical protein
MTYEIVHGQPVPREIVVYSAEIVLGESKSARGLVYSFTSIGEMWNDSPRFQVFPMRSHAFAPPDGAKWHDLHGEMRITFDSEGESGRVAVTADWLVASNFGREFRPLPESVAFALAHGQRETVTA